MTDLLPCPFCGSTNLRHEFAGSQGFIECNECGATGPYDERAADPICDSGASVTAWNCRPTPQPPADGDVAELVEWLREVDRHFNSPRPARIADLLQRQHPQPPADGDVAELVAELKVAAVTVESEGGHHEAAAVLRAADLLQRQHPQPVPVSERLPGAGDINEDGEVWIIEEGYSYALGDTGDYDWEPHKIVLRPIGQFDAKNGRTWLPHYALPTPEVNAAGEVAL